jgi:hypothetical protein
MPAREDDSPGGDRAGGDPQAGVGVGPGRFGGWSEEQGRHERR